MVLAFVCLFVAGLAFIYIAPSPDSNVAKSLLDSKGQIVEGQSVKLNDEESSNPFDEQRNSQLRSKAQDILSDLLDLKQRLEIRNVDSWAKQKFEAAIVLAEVGDQLYSRRDFEGAVDSYQESLTSMERIEQLVPEILSRKLVLAYQSFDSGKAELSIKQFKELLQIEPTFQAGIKGIKTKSKFTRTN